MISAPDPQAKQRQILVKTGIKRVHRPLDEIHEFERAIEARTGWTSIRGLAEWPPLKITSRVIYAIDRIVAPLSGRFSPRHNDFAYLSVGFLASHYFIYKTFPYFSFMPGLRMVWMYDAWESEWPSIARAMERHRVNLLFVSSRQAASQLDSLGIVNFRAHWVPEAVTVSDYKAKPITERSIDVLHFGRRWNEYHRGIVDDCREKEWTYLYEPAPGQIIFPTLEQFIEALSNAKISICVPSAITHPKRSGSVSTMTCRYLQSMAAKCLVLGRAPEEMRDLFGYNPVVEIDMERPAEQLHHILTNITQYGNLIERNYRKVVEEHQWPNRIERIEMYCQTFRNSQKNI